MQEILPPTAITVDKQVAELLSQDNSGHDISHIHRVLYLSLKFAKAENADRELVALVALLHDVDDYKLFGKEHAEKLTHAKNIMKICHVDIKTQEKVIQSLHEIGYNKRLAGKTPITLAGKIVSDADMCDGLGAAGVIRVHNFGLKHGRPFFNQKALPSQHLKAESYQDYQSGSDICHIFEKVLKLKDLMLTEAGRAEAEARHRFTVSFLEQFFQEENASDWLEILRNYES